MSEPPTPPPPGHGAPPREGDERSAERRTTSSAHRARSPQGQVMFILTVLGVIVALVIPIVAHFYRIQQR